MMRGLSSPPDRPNSHLPPKVLHRIIQPRLTLIPTMHISAIGNTILDETSSPSALQEALSAFVQQCSDVTDILPDPSFDAWAQDSLLANGVAINPSAAAHCAVDYQRSTVFIRGVYAAIEALKSRFPDTALEILYAGCGPFATLLLPILGKFPAGELKLSLLDIHQRSIDSVELLLSHFGLAAHNTHTIKDDACDYKHNQKLHLVIAETMQKSLEQEPQFAVTANLAPQLCPGGIFIPQQIEVALCLADLDYEKELLDQSAAILCNDGLRYRLATLCTLTPDNAAGHMERAQHNEETGKLELQASTVMIPPTADNNRPDAAFFTRVAVFENYCLDDYESQITLPLKCHELAPLNGGACYRVSYQLGSYPKFNFERLNTT
jgi:hypothetical protein